MGVATVAPVEVGGGSIDLLVNNGVLKHHLMYHQREWSKPALQLLNNRL